jgi:hypothetical protein
MTESAMADLKLAYRLLREFKEGKFTEGRMLSEEELRLIQVLSADLLPGTEFDEDNFHELIYLLASEDTKWNHALGEALDRFYREVEAGKTDEGVAVLNTFITICPSRWYRSLAEIERNQ